MQKVILASRYFDISSKFRYVHRHIKAQQLNMSYKMPMGKGC